MLLEFESMEIENSAPVGDGKQATVIVKGLFYERAGFDEKSVLVQMEETLFIPELMRNIISV